MRYFTLALSHNQTENKVSRSPESYLPSPYTLTVCLSVLQITELGNGFILTQ